MTKNMGKKEKGFRALLIIAGILVAVITGIIATIFIKGFINDREKGRADGRSALESFKDIAGESYIESLASLKDAKESEDALKYITLNSMYVFDEHAIEVYVESYITAAESTAQATGTTVERLIVDEWGYESIEAYREEARELSLNFIKERLAVYEIAKNKGLKIREKEYKELLGTYAVNFGYATAAEFEYACTPASIANEMLYDKTLKELE